MSESCFTINRSGACVTLSGDEQSLVWVRRRGCGYFNFSTSTPNLNSWHIVAGREHAPDVSFPIHGRDAVAPNGCEYWLNPDLRVIVVDVPCGPWRDLWCLRMVRHLLRWQLFHSGAIFLHGSVVAKGETGIAILGRRRSGKTTLLLQSLRGREMVFVAEDDLTIMRRPGGNLVALGWPGCVRFRRPMLGLFPEFAHMEQFKHPANSLDQIQDTELTRIFPEELSATLGCRHAPEASLCAIAWLDWADAASSSVMRTSEVETALLESWDILPERRPGTRPSQEHQELEDLRGFCFNPFLADVIGVPELSSFPGAIAQCAQMLKGYHVHHKGSASQIEDLFHLLGDPYSATNRTDYA